MAHRIREAMKDVDAGPIGGEGKTVEADETYFGAARTPKPSAQRKGRPYHQKRKSPFDKRPVVALVERGGEVRMFHVEDATKADVREMLVRNVDRKSRLHTDESRLYTETGGEFASHHAPSSIRRASTFATKTIVSFTQTRSRTCSPCSSAA